jgi:hypothetical protein
METSKLGDMFSIKMAEKFKMVAKKKSNEVLQANKINVCFEYHSRMFFQLFKMANKLKWRESMNVLSHLPIY